MLLVFVVALFFSAALLFCVEPMIGRMLSPLLGGAPAVWVTCVVFFQLALLAGYGYAHLTSVRLGTKRQAWLHLAVLPLPLLVLPIAFDRESVLAWPADANPSVRLLGLLTMRVGLPFFVVSTSGPLLQKWFAALGHPRGKDPYFLYAASNLGSLLALIAYPAIVERKLGLVAQSTLWRAGYVVLVVLVAVCALPLVGRRPDASKGSTEPPSAPATQTTADRVTTSRRLRWVLLAFVPSSFLLGTTTFVTTDVAAVPLFWVAPLALYLLTFVFAFATRPPIKHERIVRILPSVVIVATIFILLEAPSGWYVIAVHLLLFFVSALTCHGALARSRPSPAHLTEFYWWVSVGGALGGFFNGLLAPLVFDRLVEYPLVIVLACLCRAESWPAGSPADGANEGSIARRVSRFLAARRGDLVFPVILFAVTATLIWVAPHLGSRLRVRNIGIVFGPALVATYAMARRPVGFGLGIGAIFVASSLFQGAFGRIIDSKRNFFGVVRVALDESGRYMRIVHGSTVHGVQRLDPARRDEPASYYDRRGPAGRIFDLYNSDPASPNVGVIGLGAGALGAYARPGQEWTFYEIDPIVVQIAQDPRYFTYLADSFPGGRGLHIELGDGRLRLGRAADGTYGLLVLDAFGSDSIPLHLLTREAIAAYVSKLAPLGLLALHVSNRYLDLFPIVADLARDAGLVAYACNFLDVSAAESDDGLAASQWIAVARREESVAPLARERHCERLEARADRPVWTDDFSNVLGVYKW